MTDPAVLTVRVVRDTLDGGFVVSAAQVPGCVSQGDTVTEALANFTDAFMGYALAKALRGLDVLPRRARR